MNFNFDNENAGKKASTTSFEIHSPANKPKSLKYEHIDGKRQGSRILHLFSASQLYLFKYQCPGRYVHYKCYVPSCSASLNLDNDGNINEKSMSKKSHNHSSQEETITSLKLLKQLKAACADPSLGNAKVRDIYKAIVDERKPVPKEIQYSRIGRSLFRIREKALGHLFTDEEMQNLSEEQFQSPKAPKRGRKSKTVVDESFFSDDHFELPETEEAIEIEESIKREEEVELSCNVIVNEEPVQAIVKEELEIFDYQIPQEYMVKVEVPGINEDQSTERLTPEPSVESIAEFEIKPEPPDIFDVFKIEEIVTAQEPCTKPTKVSDQGDVRWMPFDFIEGKRKTGKLLHVLEEDQLYHFKSRYNCNISYYRCYLKKCSAGVKVQDGLNFCFRTSHKDHQHGSQAHLIREIKMVAAIKAECEDPTKTHQSIKQILRKYMTGDPREKAVFARIARNLIRIRKNVTG